MSHSLTWFTLDLVISIISSFSMIWVLGIYTYIITSFHLILQIQWFFDLTKPLIHQFHHCLITWYPLLSLPSLNSVKPLKSVICIYSQILPLSFFALHSTFENPTHTTPCCIFIEAGEKYKHTDQSYFKFIVSTLRCPLRDLLPSNQNIADFCRRLFYT